MKAMSNRSFLKRISIPYHDSPLLTCTCKATYFFPDAIKTPNACIREPGTSTPAQTIKIEREPHRQFCVSLCGFAGIRGTEKERERERIHSGRDMWKTKWFLFAAGEYCTTTRCDINYRQRDQTQYCTRKLSSFGGTVLKSGLP